MNIDDEKNDNNLISFEKCNKWPTRRAAEEGERMRRLRENYRWIRRIVIMKLMNLRCHYEFMKLIIMNWISEYEIYEIDYIVKNLWTV